MSDDAWFTDDVDDVTYRQMMQQRQERVIERELGVHGLSHAKCGFHRAFLIAFLVLWQLSKKALNTALSKHCRRGSIAALNAACSSVDNGVAFKA